MTSTIKENKYANKTFKNNLSPKSDDMANNVAKMFRYLVYATKNIYEKA